MAMNGIRDNDDVGISGYKLPKVAVALRPRAHLISKGKYGGMLDTVLHTKKMIPSPS
jgi:hypothetical protein